MSEADGEGELWRVDGGAGGGGRVGAGGAEVTAEGGAGWEEARRPGAKPVITYAVIAVCVAIWAYLNLAAKNPEYGEVTGFLLPRSFAIWTGAYWALLTSAFAHFAFWHIFFNMWWARDFGAVLEPALGRGRYLVLLLSSAAVSSGAQLAVSDETGIGFSGVVYAMFGYGLAGREAEPCYRKMADRETVKWLLGWLVLCMVLTYSGVWNVANGAHAAGFLFGFSAGSLFVARRRVAVSIAGLAGPAILTALSVFYMPWSEAWSHREMVADMVRIVDGARAGDAESQFGYGLMLKNLSEQKAEGLSWLKRSAEQGFLPAMNSLAWTMATDPDGAFRDGKAALAWAERACGQDGWANASYIDTLAAAHAELEHWDEAIAMQEKALAAAAGEPDEIRAGYELRLQKYRSREKARE